MRVALLMYTCMRERVKILEARSPPRESKNKKMRVHKHAFTHQKPCIWAATETFRVYNGLSPQDIHEA